MIKTAVIGANGFIGSYLVKELTARGFPVERTCCRHSFEGCRTLNICDKNAIRTFLSSEKPGIVFIPAANPNVEYCETHPDETRRINVDGVISVCEMCREINALPVFFSSDYVFDGDSGPYSEKDAPNPLSVYGRQKREVEMYMSGQLEKYLIARVTVVYGWERSGKNFAERTLASLRNGEIVKVPCDQIGSPSYVENVASMAVDLAQKGHTGIFHVCGAELAGRYEFACRLVGVFGSDRKLIVPVMTDCLGQKAPRPLKAGMKTDKLRKAINIKPMTIDEGLAAMKASDPYEK